MHQELMYFENSGGSTWASTSALICSALHDVETTFIDFKSRKAQLDHLVCTAQARNAVCRADILLFLHLAHDFFMI